MVVRYVRHRTLERVIDDTYKDYSAKLIITLAENCHIENGKDFSEVRQSILNPTLGDRRSGEQIIEDTFKKHRLRRL